MVQTQKKKWIKKDQWNEAKSEFVIECDRDRIESQNDLFDFR